MQVLRTVIANADRQGKGAFLHFTKPKKEDIRPDVLNLDINKIMQNVESEQFDYGTFVAAFETDPRVKTMVKNFNEKGVEVKTKNQSQPVTGGTGDEGSDTVAQMAKSATDLSDNL